MTSATTPRMRWRARERGRASRIAWTTAVVAAATIALVGIGWFMARVHESQWWSGATASDVEKAEPRVALPPSRQPDPPAVTARAARPGLASLDLAAVGAALRQRSLTIPVQGIDAAALQPSFDEARGSRRHEALDLLARSGTPVLAVEDGTVAKLFTSEAGGLTIYHFDEAKEVAYYYAHLDRYAEGLADGQTVRRGQVLGYVGVTGNADPNTPHLHFAIFKLGPERRWWEGDPVDPYAVLRP